MTRFAPTGRAQQILHRYKEEEQYQVANLLFLRLDLVTHFITNNKVILCYIVCHSVCVVGGVNFYQGARARAGGPRDSVITLFKTLTHHTL